MQLKVTVTEQTRPTRAGNGYMQTVGIHNGSAFPLEHAVYRLNADQPLKPGEYMAEARLRRNNDFELVVDFRADDLTPVKAG